MSHGMSEEIKRLHRLLDRKDSGSDDAIIANEKVIADLRAVFSLNECGFTELINAAIEANADTVRLDWFMTLTAHKLARIRGAFMNDAGDIRAAIDAAIAWDNGGKPLGVAK